MKTSGIPLWEQIQELVDSAELRAYDRGYAEGLEAARDRLLSALNNRTYLDTELQKAIVTWLRL